nr:MAG TPA: crystallin beta/gamma motif-containing protein [Herelleviridae sp.]
MRIVFQQNTLDAIQKSRFFTHNTADSVLKAAQKTSSLNATSKKDGKFRYFQKKIIECLTQLEEEKSRGIKKSFSYMVDTIVKSKFPVGTIREWKGKKYIKIAPGKWRPKYDSNSRGAKLAVAALKRKAEQCKTSQELLQLVLENRDRFSDKDGKPLPFVQELRDYVSGLNDKVENTKNESKPKKPNYTEKKTQENKQSEGNGGESPDDGYPEKDYPEYKGKGQKAVDFIVKQKGGQVRGAFNRPEIGDIDVVWGKITNAQKHEGYGLAHIIDKHGIEATKKIGDAIKNGDIIHPNNDNRIAIESNGYHIGLRQQWNGQKKNWIITAFDKEAAAKTTRSTSDYTGETLPATSKQSIAQSEGKSSGGIADKMEQWKKEGRKIVKDDRGLYFYESMSPSEKIEWIETEIARLEHENTSLKEKNANQTPDHHTDTMNYYHNGGDPKKLGKYLDDLDSTRKQQRTQQIKENEEEIKQYKEDVDYYAHKTHAESTTRAIPQPDGKSSSIKQIRKKYESAPSVTGNKKTVTLPNGTKIKCRYKLVEADAPTASHDENTYSPTKGFPTSKDGKTVNDRDYQNDKDAQESVRKIAANFNSLALESPPIVTKDGIVVSGNNRTMSSKLAAKNGSDAAYVADLKEMIDEYGLEESDLEGFKHPRLVLEMDGEHEGEYTTEEFAQFNRDTKKTMSNVEKAVKVTKTLNEEKIQSIASQLSGYETMGELYADAKGCQYFVAKLIDAGIIGDNEKAQYLKSDGTLNDTGKDFTETVLVGTILNEDNIRRLDSAGGKRIRQKLVRAILPLVENKGTGKEYSFNKELNEAVDIAVSVAKNHEIYPNVETYLAQGTLFGESKPDEITGKLAKLIHDEGEKAFASRMKNLGAGLKHSAEGEMDIFLGGVETKQSLMERFLTIQKAITDILTNLYTKERTIHSIVADELQKQCG